MLALLLLVCGPTGSALASPLEDFDAAIVRMLAAVASVRDATFDLHQQEYVGGRLRDPEVMHVKYRPYNVVYVEWDNGQRLLWDPAKNDGKMRVDPGRFVPTISLSPDSSLAMRGQRHSIRRMGLAPVAALFDADRKRMIADPALQPTVTDLGTSTLFGRTARCFDASMRKDLEPRLYALRIEVCVDVATGLLLRTRSWDQEDGEVRLVEEYGYDKLSVNVGLTDADFDPVALGL